MSETKTKKKPSLMQVLNAVRNGNMATELLEAIEAAGQGVRETKGVTKVTLTLTMKPGQGSHKAVIINDSIDLKLPKKKAGETLFFCDDDSSLTRNDPDQYELQGLQVVTRADDAGKTNVRKVAAAE